MTHVEPLVGPEIAPGIQTFWGEALSVAWSPNGRRLAAVSVVESGEGAPTSQIRFGSIDGDSYAEIELGERVMQLLFVSDDELWVLANDAERDGGRIVVCLAAPDGGELARFSIDLPGNFINLRASRGDLVLAWSFLQLGTSAEKDPASWFLFSKANRALERAISTAPLRALASATQPDSPASALQVEWVPVLDPDGASIVCRANAPDPRTATPALFVMDLLTEDKIAPWPGLPGGAIRGLRWIGRDCVLDLGFDRRAGGVLVSSTPDGFVRRDGLWLPSMGTAPASRWGGNLPTFAVNDSLDRVVVWGRTSPAGSGFFLLASLPDLTLIDFRWVDLASVVNPMTPVLVWRGESCWCARARENVVELDPICDRDRMFAEGQHRPVQLEAGHAVRSIALFPALGGSALAICAHGWGDAEPTRWWIVRGNS